MARVGDLKVRFEALSSFFMDWANIMLATHDLQSSQPGAECL
jgi:hypothetical protein